MLSITAHAKINFSLDVLGLLYDGYHEVEMVMQSLELHDTLFISSGTGSEEIKISTDSDLIPPGKDNLVYKAAHSIKEYTGINKPVHIHIDKRIPVAAGLGGGSSDAAAALLGLNKFFNAGLKWEQLMELAEKLGADVPFCMLGKTALAKGKGENLKELVLPPDLGIVLVKPAFGVSTGKVYKLYDELFETSTSYSRAMVNALEKGDIRCIADNLGNALEPVTAYLHPEIREIKEELKKAGALGAEMTGSGPTVFGLTKSRESARQLAKELKYKYEQVLDTCTGLFYPSLQ